MIKIGFGNATKKPYVVLNNECVFRINPNGWEYLSDQYQRVRLFHKGIHNIQELDFDKYFIPYFPALLSEIPDWLLQ